MRIIAGTRRGHKLFDFEGADIRPTTDRVKESMFNLIQAQIRDAAVLDLFGGSGALSFEALSRGAGYAVLLDIDPRSIALIRKNADKLDFSDRVSVLEIAAEKYLESAKEQFDIVFLDPPYNQGFVGPVLKTIAVRQILKPEGIAVLESDSTDDHGQIPGLTILKQRKYGRTFVTIYQRGDKQ